MLSQSFRCKCAIRCTGPRCQLRLKIRMLTLLLHLLLSSVAQSRNFRQDKAHICIVTCDFWGLPAAGGTATAYHLLAASLADAGPRVWPVTFLGATHQTSLCQDIQQNFSSGSINFECLKPEHFLPEVVNNFPYEALGIAVVRWLQRSGQKCVVGWYSNFWLPFLRCQDRHWACPGHS